MLRVRRAKMMRKTKETITSIIMLATLIIIGMVFIWSQNSLVLVKKYIYNSELIPKSFVGTNIVHISDLYNTDKGVYSKVRNCKPDLIIVTGNLSDADGRFDKSASLLTKLTLIAPTYYVPGEYDQANLASIKSSISAIDLTSTRVSIAAPSIDPDKFIEEYVGDKFIKKANAGDEDAIQYIQYIRESLEKSSKAYIEISGLPVFSGTIDYMDEAYKVLDKDKEVYQIIAMPQCEYSYGIAKSDVHMILTGNHLNNSKTDGRLPVGKNDVSGTSIFIGSGIGNNDIVTWRFLDYPDISLITLSDGMIDTSNPLEKFLGMFISDVKTRFDGDAGFKTYTYRYENNPSG